MRVYLVFPPGQTDIAQPYTSLPQLSGVLKKNKHSVIQKDLGIEAIKFFTSPKELNKSYEFASKRFKQLLILEKNGRLTNDQSKEFESLCTLIRENKMRGKISGEFKKAVKTIRCKKSFLNPKKLESALRSIGYLLMLTSAKFYPTSWSSSAYKQKFNETEFSSLIEALGNKEENLFITFFDQEVIPQILKAKPDLVGISISFYHQIIPGLTLARMIKEKNKNIHICLGGTILMYMTEALQKNKDFFSFFDSVILHEGETALLELLERLKTDRDLSKVPNILFYDGRQVIKSKITHIEDINLLPPPCYDGFQLDDYISPHKVLALTPSRGCYWNKCAFCGVCPTTQLRYRERKPELFLKDILCMKEKYGVTHFSFNGVIIPPRWLDRLSTLILENKLSIKWDSEVRFEEGFTQELCHKLYKAGCCYLRFGFESGNQRILDLMLKGTDLKTIQKIIDNCYNAQIQVGLQAFVGFPGETVEEAKDTINFIIKNYKKISSTALGNFQLFNYSPIFTSPKEFGITIKKSKSIIQYNHNYKVKRGMSYIEASDFRENAAKRFNRLKLHHIFSASGSVYSILYAAHYKTRFSEIKKTL